MSQHFDVIICGAGSIGVAATYYLAQQKGITRVLLVDKHAPLSQTSAKSGENYRNWWPQEVMVRFTNRSIDLMDALADESGNVFQMSRRGYAYVSSQAEARDRVLATVDHYGRLDVGQVRVHESPRPLPQPLSQAGERGEPLGELPSYRFSPWAGFAEQPDGADLLLDQGLIRQTFPHFAHDVQAVVHARRCGAISAQQLGMYLLGEAKKVGVREVRGEVCGVEQDADGVSAVLVKTAEGTERFATRTFINAAGPFSPHVAQMLGIELPVFSVFQQKIAFQDLFGVIPRGAPFTIFTDAQYLAWSEEEKEFWLAEPAYHWLLNQFPGGLHIKPEGGKDSKWIKLGWAFNHTPEEPLWERDGTPGFLDVMLRGAARLVPELERYFEHVPQPLLHYGGYYTKTRENRPLIGPLEVKGAYVVGAFAGFGTMTSCAAGELIATWVAGDTLPDYAPAFSPARYDDAAYVASLDEMDVNGEL